ncbi:unnamed protein product [Chrysoparadoxa australica]
MMNLLAFPLAPPAMVSLCRGVRRQEVETPAVSPDNNPMKPSMEPYGAGTVNGEGASGARKEGFKDKLARAVMGAVLLSVAILARRARARVWRAAQQELIPLTRRGRG